MENTEFTRIYLDRLNAAALAVRSDSETLLDAATAFADWRIAVYAAEGMPLTAQTIEIIRRETLSSVQFWAQTSPAWHRI